MGNIIEEKFGESKVKLKSIIDDSRTIYSQIKNEFDNGKKRINSDQYLNKDGKRVQIEKLLEDYRNHAYREAGKCIDQLINNVGINIIELEKSKLEKQGFVKEELLP